MNIGIDFHDTISASPEFYKKLISKWEGKVYIVTGTPKSKRYETIKQIHHLGIYPRVDNSEYPYVYDEILMGFEYKKEEMTMNHFQKMKEHKLKLIQEHDVCINLVGILFEKKNNTFKNIHVNLPSVLSRICKENSKIDCYCRRRRRFISS